MSSPSKRRELDVMRLMMRDFTVEAKDDRIDEFNVVFHGPKESPYEGGVWKLHVQLPVDYPYKPPKITFLNKIFHPNINQDSGLICLNVINKSWSPMSDLVNVFEIFLPQLLLYPESSDGLNEDAIFLLMTNKKKFEHKVKGVHLCLASEYRDLYAKEENVIGSCSAVENDEEGVSDSDDEDSLSGDDSAADGVAGHLEL